MSVINTHFSTSFQVMGTAAIHHPKHQGENFLQLYLIHPIMNKT